MKFLAYLIVLLLGCSQAPTQSKNPYIKNPYIREDPIGKRITPEENSQIGAFQFKPIEKWISEKFIFLPAAKKIQRYGYQSFGVSYEKYVGRIATVISVQRKSIGHEVVFRMDDNGKELNATAYSKSIHNIGPLADFDSARSKWLNKTLWYKKDNVSYYDERNDKFIGLKVKKYLPVKIVGIVAGWYNHAPVRFIIQLPSGDEGFVDLNLSGTNVSPVLQKHSKFEDYFFEKNPRKLFSWSNEIWSAIESEKVFVGMTSEQAQMSWGKPIEINRTNIGSSIHEQWVYGSGNYLYFENDILKVIQN